MNLLKIILISALFAIPSLANAKEMVALPYYEVEDCPYPSERIPVPAEHGMSYQVKQDPRCETIKDCPYESTWTESGEGHISIVVKQNQNCKEEGNGG